MGRKVRQYRPTHCAVEETMAAPPCPCGRPRTATLATPVELEADDVTARLEGVVVLVCDDRHREVADRDLAAHLHAGLADQLLVARPRRLRREDACGACGAVLTLPARRTQTPVVVDDGPSVVTLVPDLPMPRCPDCGREQVAPSTDRTLHALVEALAAATGAGVDA